MKRGQVRCWGRQAARVGIGIVICANAANARVQQAAAPKVKSAPETSLPSGPILLRFRARVGDVFEYRQNVRNKSVVKSFISGQPTVGAPESKFETSATAIYKVLSITPQGKLTLSLQHTMQGTSMQGGDTQELPKITQAWQETYTSSGARTSRKPLASASPNLVSEEMIYLFLFTLPTRAIKIGDTWNGSSAFLEDQCKNGEETYIAHFTGIEKRQGIFCARVEYKLKLNTPQKTFQDMIGADAKLKGKPVFEITMVFYYTLDRGLPVEFDSMSITQIAGKKKVVQSPSETCFRRKSALALRRI